MADNIYNDELITLYKNAEQNRVFVETLMGFDVYVADEFCNYVMGGTNVASAVTAYDTVQKKMAIYVNSKLVNGSKKLYDAICLHELGHIFSGHLHADDQLSNDDHSRDDAQGCVLIDDRIELEADAWAVEHGADAEALCDYLKNILELKIFLIGEEYYKQLLETNEAVKMADNQLKVRIAALSK